MTAPKPKITPEQFKKYVEAAIEEINAARPVVKKMIDKARAYIVLDHPFFASIMLKKPMVERLDIPTLAVDPQGKIYYNPMFLKELTNDQLVGAICHEVLHYASGHSVRRGSRDPQKWNCAADAWINDTLNQSNIPITIPGIVSMPGSAQKTVEQIYDELPEDDGNGKGPGNPSGNPSGGNDPMQGDLDDDGDGEGQPSDAEAKEIDAQRKMDVAEASQIAKMKGKLPGVLEKFASETVDSRVPWFDILERYMTERVKNDYSWARPNRRYMPEFYLPTIDGVGAMGEVVIQVDISGSVSRQEIAHYNGHLKRIVEQCRPSKVHVIYTDTEVQKHEEFDKPEDVEIQFYSGGGTDMRAGFDYIEAKGIEPEVVVTLTDGYTPFPGEGQYAVDSVWCISTDQRSPVGENIHFDLNDARH